MKRSKGGKTGKTDDIIIDYANGEFVSNEINCSAIGKKLIFPALLNYFKEKMGFPEKMRDEYVFAVLNEQKDKWICRLCGMSYKYTKRSNMRPLFRHINKHTDSDLNSFIYKCIDELFLLHNCDSKNHLLKFIATTCQSLSIVEEKHFNQLLDCVSSGLYESTTRKIITSILIKEMRSCFEKIRSITTTTTDYFTVTFDLWQPSKNAFGYIGVSLFCLNQDFELFCFPIAFRRIYSLHSAEKIKRLMELILERIGLSFTDKNINYCTDGGSNVKCACEGLNWIYCIAHMLERSLSCAETMDSTITEQLKICDEIAIHFKERNSDEYKILFDIQNEIEKEEQHEEMEEENLNDFEHGNEM